MDRVKSLSIRLNNASTSPLCNRSGGRSSVQRVIRANPCCGPNVHGPNWAVGTKDKTGLVTLFMERIVKNCLDQVILTKNERDSTANRFFAIENCQFARKKQDNGIQFEFSFQFNIVNNKLI